MADRWQGLPGGVARGEPLVWRNPARQPAAQALAAADFRLADIEDARARWTRFGPLLAALFPVLRPTAGRIDSPLSELPSELAARVAGGPGRRVLVKHDDALPVTGCIKARGGVYEVLVLAERLALDHGLLEDVAAPRQPVTGAGPGTDADAGAGPDAGAPGHERLAGPAARALFGRFTLVLGSTGNLGFSVGVMGRALGFEVEVHLSHDAKAWKKDRLRALGARVIEHADDYSRAVRAAREAAAHRPDCHFVDDESSAQLFLGYATAAFDLRAQLQALGVAPSPARPLVVYLPCGVGGAPGGVAFGLKQLYGDAVVAVFVEPVASPCVLVQLASGLARPVSVYDIGLDNRTAADGLAVGTASMLVARQMLPLLDAVVTVRDADLFDWCARLWRAQGLRLEPSAAAGFAALAPATAALALPPDAIQVVWTTGGGLLPDEPFEAVLAMAGDPGLAGA